MPRVQAYGQARVRQAERPGVYRRPEGAGAAIADFGATASRAAATLGNVIAAERQQAKSRADETAVLAARNELAQWENEAVYNPSGGVLAKKGKDTFELPRTIETDFDAAAGDIESRLGNDEQRQAFLRVRMDRREAVLRRTYQHVSSEVENYHAQESAKGVELSIQAAIANADDLGRVGSELQSAEAIIRRQMASAPKEAIDVALLDVRTKVHEGVITQYARVSEVNAGQMYYDEVKGFISVDARDRIEKTLEEAALRRDSQQQTDAIKAAGGGLKEWRAKAAQIENAKIRDEVTRRLEHEDIINSRLDREAEEGLLGQAYEIIDRTGTVGAVPPDIWRDVVRKGHGAALRSYAKGLAGGGKAESDGAEWYRLMRMADSDTAKFRDVNLLALRPKMDEGEFKELARLQRTIREEGRKGAEKELAGFMTDEQTFSSVLREYGLDPTPKEGAKETTAVAQLRRIVQQQVNAIQSDGKTKASPEDVRSILDQTLSGKAGEPGSWWNILPGGKPFWSTEKRIVDLAIGDVPKKDRALIEQALRAKGRPVSDATVLGMYVDMQLRNQGR